MKKTRVAENIYRVEGDGPRAYFIARFRVNGKQYDRSLGGEGQSLRQLKAKLGQIIANFETTQNSKKRFADIMGQAVADIGSVKRWRNPKSEQQWLQSLRDYCLPVLGHKALKDISREDVLAVLRPLWDTKTETASRVRMRLEAVLNWGITRNLLTGPNVAVWRGNLDLFLPARSKVKPVRHHEAMTLAETQKAVAYCLSHQSPASAAILFGIATVGRVSEFRLALWQEIEGDTWMMPSSRRKDGKEFPHRVPLSTLAKKALDMAKTSGCESDFIFSFQNRLPLSADTPRLKLIDIIGRPVTMHGVRSTFRDWAAIHGIQDAVAEKSLSHKWGNEVTEAYYRTDLLEQRRVVMEQWADALIK